MEPLHIRYTVYIKNPKKKSAHYYGRVRERNCKVFDVDLKTTDKAKAEAWRKLRTQEVEMVNSKILLGEHVSEEQLRSIVRISNKYVQPVSNTVTNKSVSIMQAIDEYNKHLRRTGRRDSTVNTYNRALKAIFGDHFHESIQVINDDFVLNCMAQFDNLKPTTRKNYSVVCHELMKFLFQRYDMSPKLINSVPQVKVTSTDRVFWDTMEMRHIIDHVQCRDKVMEKQMKVYFTVMSQAGSRQGETARLRWDDFKDGRLHFRASETKTGEERYVPLFYHTQTMINRLREPGSNGLIFNAIPKSQGSRFAILRRAIIAANKERNADHQIPLGGLHTFRHSVANLLYRDRDGKRPDIKTLCTMLGHSPNTALTYYIRSKNSTEVQEMVNDIYSEEPGTRGPLDDLIEAGLL